MENIQKETTKKKPSVRQIRKKKDTGIYMKNVLTRKVFVEFSLLGNNIIENIPFNNSIFVLYIKNISSIIIIFSRPKSVRYILILKTFKNISLKILLILIIIPSVFVLL